MAASSSASLPCLNGVMVAKHWPSIPKVLGLLTVDATCSGAATALAVPPVCKVLLQGAEQRDLEDEGACRLTCPAAAVWQSADASKLADLRGLWSYLLG